MQPANTAYEGADRSPSKTPDFAFVLAGHPTIFTVGSDAYSIPSTGASGLTTGNGFSTVRRWLNAPKIAASKIKTPHPEGGECDIGACDVEILDRMDAGTRAWTELLSRQALLEGNAPGNKTSLSAGIGKATTIITLADVSAFDTGDIVWIGHEAILLGDRAGNTFGNITPCTRGYLLTTPTEHAAGVACYDYLPSVFRQPAYVFKGYRDVSLDLWLKGFGGTVVGLEKGPGLAKVRLRPFTWDAHLSRQKKLVSLRAVSTDESETEITGTIADLTLSGDYTAIFTLPAGTDINFNDGHYMVGLEDVWFGITGVQSSQAYPDGTTRYYLNLVKGLGSGVYDVDVAANQPVHFGWSNVVWNTDPRPTPSDPIDLLLQFLTSVKGNAANGAYDLLRRGIGLGIPVEHLDLASFTAVKAEDDYDDSAKVYFVFTEPVDAKDFIEKELCKPFGWYLTTGNDGRIKLVRPRNPAKFYTSRANNQFRFKTSASSRNKQLEISNGVRTGAQMAAAIQSGLNATSDGGFTVTWSSATFKFTISKSSGTFDILRDTAETQETWDHVGYTTAATGVSSRVSDVPVARPSSVSDSANSDFLTVTASDCWDVTGQDNQPAQVAEVRYRANYDWITKVFQKTRRYLDAEIANLADYAETKPHLVESKGLLIVYTLAGQIDTSIPVIVYAPQDSGCMPRKITPTSSFGLDNRNSFASLFAESMFDRYRNPPLRIRCKLKWKYNRVEVGDVLTFTYAVEGVLADTEQATSTLTSRLFEVISVKPAFGAGHIEVELMGHRLG